MNDEQKARMREGRMRYFNQQKEGKNMKMEDDEMGKEAVPPQRAERMERIANEIKADAAPMAQPKVLGVKLSIDEMRLDYAAHVCVIEQTKKSVEAMGLPPHLANTMAQNLLAGHLQRLADLTEVLKRY